MKWCLQTVAVVLMGMAVARSSLHGGCDLRAQRSSPSLTAEPQADPVTRCFSEWRNYAEREIESGAFENKKAPAWGQ